MEHSISLADEVIRVAPTFRWARALIHSVGLKADATKAFLNTIYGIPRQKHGHGYRVHPRRAKRRPKARAICGGRNAWTSSRPRAAAARRAGGGIVQQIRFRREALKNRHGHARSTLTRGFLIRLFPSRLEVFAVIFENKLGQKKRAF